MSSSNNNNNAGGGAGNPKQSGLRGFGFFSQQPKTPATPYTLHQPTTEEQQDPKSNGGKENPTLCGGKKVTPVPVKSGGTKHTKRKHQSTTTKNDGASKKKTLSIPSLPSPPNNKQQEEGKKTKTASDKKKMLSKEEMRRQIISAVSQVHERNQKQYSGAVSRALSNKLFANHYSAKLATELQEMVELHSIHRGLIEEVVGEITKQHPQYGMVIGELNLDEYALKTYTGTKLDDKVPQEETAASASSGGMWNPPPEETAASASSGGMWNPPPEDFFQCLCGEDRDACGSCGVGWGVKQQRMVDSGEGKMIGEGQFLVKVKVPQEETDAADEEEKLDE